MRESRVLIIDDSLTIRAMVESILASQANCHSFALAPDIPTARSLMKSFGPTIITLDLNLPGVTGFAFLDELRHYPHAPIVVLSSSTSAGSETANRAIERGADAVFDKSRIMSDSKAFIRVLKKASVHKVRKMRLAPST